MVGKDTVMVIQGGQGRRAAPRRAGVSAGAWRGLRRAVPLALVLWGVLVLLVRWLLGG